MTLSHAEVVLAGAMAPGGAGSNAVLTQVVFFGAIFAIFYFLLIRPQQQQRRQREAMLAAVKRGDKVVTSSGIHGTITAIDEQGQTITLRVADQVRLTFDRGSVARVLEVTSKEDA
jgi:preprotein translocase subunit YajC